MSIDALTSPTLKHVRELWWGDEFTEFLAEMLRPRPGNRILDVGCGPGTGEVNIGRLHVSQLRLVGVDVKADKVIAARQETRAHNQRVGFAAADACRLPFRDGAFNSTFCVAVLQHVHDVELAITEFARVTANRGRIVAVEPDNSARYAYSSTPIGSHAFEMAERLFSALAHAREEPTDPAVGPRVSSFFEHAGIELVDVRLFPVSEVRRGALDDAVWRQRRERVERIVADPPTPEVRRLGKEYLSVLEVYRTEARQAGPSFVEIQNTMLFATVGQKSDG